MSFSAGASKLLVTALVMAGIAAPIPAAFDSPPSHQAGFDDRWPGAAGRSAAPTTVAQAPGAASSQSRSKPAQPQQPPPAQNAAASPVSLDQALYLIRSTLLTLNDANRSGNYTVLRDLAAPGFQVRNSAADLGVIFADLRRRRVDLFAVALIAPQLAAAPALDSSGMLRLSGHFPTEPLQIKFDLLFENVERNWRLFGISVQTPEVAPQANVPAAPKR
jgi:hypothetical protein